MIRLVQRKLIIPRGDTGSFSIPVLPNTNSGDIAVFSILNPLKHERLFDKEIKEFGDSLQIRFTHEETVNLPAGQYNWDIKLYRNPVIENNILVSGEEIDSYYAAFSLPICEIRETGDNYIVSPDAPNSYLRPDQIEIITGAIAALNAAVEKTEQNVEHYPKIIDEQWYTWDAESGEYVATGVSANGNTGNGIESVVLNNDYTLTLNFTDGTSYTTASIRGTTGNGIEDIVLNNDYTLTIIYSDGNSYTTPSIRGPIGPTPQFSIGTVQEGAAAAATITGTAENPVLNLTLSNAKVPTRVSQLENDSGYLNVETDPTVPAWAKAANKPAYTAAEVGAPTIAEMNTAIGEAIGQINSFDMAVVQTLPTQDISTHTIYLVPKTGETNDVYDEYVYINNAWEMVGNTQIDLNDYALKSELPTKVSDLTDDSGHYTKPANGIPASDLADGVIPTVPVQDVQINGTSVIQNGIANVPIAGRNLGAVRVAATSGIDIDSTYGILSLSQTTDAMIKAGTSIYAISPKTQHAAAFYGLAKAAGDTTQAASDNAVGTYTDEAKNAIRHMIDALGLANIRANTGINIVEDGDTGETYLSVDVKDVQVNGSSIVNNNVANIPLSDYVTKVSLDNAGISNKTYTTKLGGAFSVTTAAATGYINPYARASVTGRFEKTKYHRVTVNGTEYVLRTRLWYEVGMDNFKVYEYLGNLQLYMSDVSGVPGEIDNVPFIIISDLDDNNSIDVLTSQAGTYNILVEEITNTQTSLPKTLIWNNAYVPIEKNNNGGTYSGFSIGVNELRNKRGTIALGYCNRITNQFSATIGMGNSISGEYGIGIGAGIISSGDYAIGIGYSTTASGMCAFSSGLNTTASGQVSHAEGQHTTASGKISHAENNYTVASGHSSHAENYYTIANGYAQHASGRYNVVDIEYPEWVASTSYAVGDRVTYSNAGYECITANSDSSWTSSKWKNIRQTTTHAFIVGNGMADDQRSNAYALDWSGNGYYGGDIYVNCNSDSTGGIKLAALSDVQVNGTSIISNGVANIPYATASQVGVVKKGYALYMGNDGTLNVNLVSDATVKAGTGGEAICTVSRQHIATFYGLAKVAGADEKDSTLPLGTYSDNAKAAIQRMLDVPSVAEAGAVVTENVSGATPVIEAAEGHRYVCGEVTSINFTPSSYGLCELMFTSGSTVTVLTLPSTVKMPEWFEVETERVYDIIITDGVYGAVTSWAM